MKKIIDNYKNFRLSSFYDEYKVIPLVLSLFDIIFAIALIYGIGFGLNRTNGFVIVLSVSGLICAQIGVVLYYQFVVVPIVSMDKIRKKYSLELGVEGGEDRGTMADMLNIVDKIMANEYSGKLLQKQAELEAMKNQINPHFLYNTLDTIRGYASIENAPITGNMIEILSHLFRYTVSSKQERVTISQELGIAREYIKIQEYRSNVFIQMIETVDDDVQPDEYYMPKMILQPIIENAIQHGMPGEVSEFVIKIHIYRTQSRLIIRISDNGVGMDTETVARLNKSFMTNPLDDFKPSYSRKRGTGIALTNINKRIKLMFGQECGLYCYSTYGEGAVFEISLPMNK